MATIYIIRLTCLATSWLPQCLLQPWSNSWFSSFSLRSKCTEHLTLQSEPNPQSISCPNDPIQSKQFTQAMENLLVSSEVRALPTQMCSILPKHTVQRMSNMSVADFFHMQYQRCVHINNSFNKNGMLARCLPTWIDFKPSVRWGSAELMHTFNLLYSDSLENRADEMNFYATVREPGGSQPKTSHLSASMPPIQRYLWLLNHKSWKHLQTLQGANQLRLFKCGRWNLTHSQTAVWLGITLRGWDEMDNPQRETASYASFRKKEGQTGFM